MRKFLIGLLAVFIIAICGCTFQEEYTKVSHGAEIEYLWCPKIDSILVKWLPEIKSITSQYETIDGDCVRFSEFYEVTHDSLKLCEEDSLNGLFISEPYSRAYYYADTREVFFGLVVPSENTEVVRHIFPSRLATLNVSIYGCSEFDCDKAEKIHAYTYSYHKEDGVKDTLLNIWLTSEQFKIEKTEAIIPKDYEMYLHFKLLIDSPELKATIESKQDSNMYWGNPQKPHLIGA